MCASGTNPGTGISWKEMFEWACAGMGDEEVTDTGDGCMWSPVTCNGVTAECFISWW